MATTVHKPDPVADPVTAPHAGNAALIAALQQMQMDIGRLQQQAAAIIYALSERTPHDLSPLTTREAEVADLVAKGLTNKQIADSLTIAERTAEGHVEHIFNKLGFTCRTQIAAWVLTLAGAGQEAGS